MYGYTRNYYELSFKKVQNEHLNQKCHPLHLNKRLTFTTVATSLGGGMMPRFWLHSKSVNIARRRTVSAMDREWHSSISNFWNTGIIKPQHPRSRYESKFSTSIWRRNSNPVSKQCSQGITVSPNDSQLLHKVVKTPHITALYLYHKNKELGFQLGEDKPHVWKLF